MKFYIGENSGGRLSGNQFEDDSAMMIYRFDKSILKSARPFDVEGFAAFTGARLSVYELEDDPDLLGVAAFEPQSYLSKQGSITLFKEEIAVNLAFLQRGMAMYRYAVAHLWTHLYFQPKETEKAHQLSFGLSETPSLRHSYCNLQAIHSQRLLDETGEELLFDDYALSLLMPKITFKTAIGEYFSEAGLNRNKLKGGELEFLCRRLGEDFGVPDYLVLVRLKKLNYIYADL